MINFDILRKMDLIEWSVGIWQTVRTSKADLVTGTLIFHSGRLRPICERKISATK